ncbi:uncharacterized protein ARMOST_21418 [Armillaria ostoyae]|uniref:Uncharacterized protein n=1 Tax=Armillaria ostoyae TaxID=47428 RepID=A0A284SA26_ARMOS|nr:uncharacterized protein ARMOST_21418 [Armillaria ostoyae]
MTEYDFSPEAAERYQATMRRISRWVDDAEAHACEFKSPFVPRSDVGDDDVPPQPVLTRGLSHRVPTPLYAPVPGPMPPHSHGPAPPPRRPPPVPLHGPAPPPSQSRHTHSPTRHSSTRHSSSHHSKHRSGSTFYISPTPTPPPVPYYAGYPNNNPYYQAQPSPYAPPPPRPQYYRSGNVPYAPPPGGYVVIPQKGRSSKLVSSVQPVVFSTSSSTDSEPLPQRQPQSGSFLQKVFPFTHGRRDSPVPAAYDHQREHRPHHHHHHHHHRHSA